MTDALDPRERHDHQGSVPGFWIQMTLWVSLLANAVLGGWALWSRSGDQLRLDEMAGVLGLSAIVVLSLLFAFWAYLGRRRAERRLQYTERMVEGRLIEKRLDERYGFQ